MPESLTMEIFLQDLRYSFRILRKNLTFTAIAIVTLALGIGVNTAIFTVTNGLFLRNLPVENPQQLVRIDPYTNEGSDKVVSYPAYIELSRRSRYLELAAHQSSSISFSTGRGSTNVQGELVSGNYFDTYGIHAPLGRTLSLEDDRKANPVAVISHRLWNEALQKDPGVIGRNIYLNGNPFTIVGVLAATFRGSYLTSNSDVWTCISMHEQVRPRGVPLQTWGWGWLHLTARINGNSTMEQAQSEITNIALQLQKEFPRTNQGVNFRIVRATALPESLHKSMVQAMGFLTIVAVLVLLVVCANVAGAILPRVVARSKETAIRKSLGATQTRLARQWFTESVTLSLPGGLAGVILAIWFKEVLTILLPPEWQILVPALSLDIRVLGFAFGISLLTGILCGTTPVLQLRKTELQTTLKGNGGKIRKSRLFGFFVSAQTAICVVLLIIASLLLKSALTSTRFDLGFNTTNLLLATIDTQRHGYSNTEGVRLFESVSERLRLNPLVKSASYATVTPLDNGRESQGYEIETIQGKKTISIATNSVGARYFETMGIPFVSGRDFTESDVRGVAPAAAIVNETLARQFWQRTDVTGKRVRLQDGPELEIIGVVKDIQYYAVGEERQPYIYTTPNVLYPGFMTMQIRTSADPATLSKTILAEIAAVDPKVAPYDVLSFSKLRSVQLFPLRSLATISTVIGVLALILTSLGVYGVLAYSVTQRTKEIGLRMALGATRGSIIQLVLRQGFTFVLIGTSAGLLMALSVTRFLSSILFHTSPTDGVSFVAVTTVLFVVTVIAALVPSRRAMDIEPTIALRYE